MRRIFLCTALMFLLGKNLAAEMSVGFVMRISPGQQELIYTEGVNHVVTCEATASEDNQKPTLRWEFDGENITSTLSSGRKFVVLYGGRLALRVRNVQHSDEGVYTCVATLGSLTDSRSFRLIVVEQLKVHSSVNQFGMFGGDGIIQCNATSRPFSPTIIWRFENYTRIENSDKYLIRQDGLYIRDLTHSDSGVYLCDIVIIESGKQLFFLITFKVIEVPKMDTVPIISPANPKVGDPEVKITCHATGEPKPVYSFKRGDNVLGDSMVDSHNGILTLTNLRQEDQGIYTCKAVNKGGIDETSIFLDVRIPPEIYDIYDVTDAVEGEQIKITCRARGDPAPTVYWQKNDLPHYSDGLRDDGPDVIDVHSTDQDDADIKTTRKILNFNPVRPQDVAKYACVALNIVGNASKTIKFEARYKPHFDTNFKETVFYGWEGHTANLTCLASANNLAIIHWYHDVDGEPIRIENVNPYTLVATQQWPQYFLSSGSLLVYVNNDSSPVLKDYTCEAENELGLAYRTVTLRSGMPPSVPVVMISIVKSTKVVLEVRAPTDNGSHPLTGYRCIYYADFESDKQLEKNVEITPGVTVVELTDLKANTLYWIRTAARNAVGIRIESVISIKTQEMTAPLKLNIVSPSLRSEPNTYTLEWETPDDGGSPIERYLVTFQRVMVTVNKPDDWIISKYIDRNNRELVITNPDARNVTLTRLDRYANYHIGIYAVNLAGSSPWTYKLIKTSLEGENSTTAVYGAFEMQIYPNQTIQQYKAGENRILICETTVASGIQKPKLNWLVNGEKYPLDNRRMSWKLVTDFSSTRMSMYNLQDGFQATFTCVATLGSLTDSRSVRVQVIRANSTAAVSEGFEIQISPNQTDQQFKVGENRFLICDIREATGTEGNQRKTLQWEFNKSPITSTSPSDRIFVTLNRDSGSLKLTVKDVQHEDEATYTCVATLGSLLKSKSVRVQVIDPITIIPPGGTDTTNVGAIVGGSVAGILVIMTVIVIVTYLKRKGLLTKGAKKKNPDTNINIL